MDFYERKLKAKNLIKTMLSNKKTRSTEAIIFAVEDSFQFSPKWTEAQIERIKEK